MSASTSEALDLEVSELLSSVGVYIHNKYIPFPFLKVSLNILNEFAKPITALILHQNVCIKRRVIGIPLVIGIAKS